MENEIYLLTNDGHRDSVHFGEYASNEAELKSLLIKEAIELCERVSEESIKIDFENGFISYSYNDLYNDVDSKEYTEVGKWYFFTVKKITT